MHTRDEIIDSLSARLESLEASSQAYQAEARETHGKLLDGQGRLESGQERVEKQLAEITRKLQGSVASSEPLQSWLDGALDVMMCGVGSDRCPRVCDLQM